ncbi:MAG: 4-hydroxy-3-methylbut-2-en-1-yl diphosphate synthase (flavodoxin) [Syntrophus sp. SKADARSKE-3]|nr:4-hydroxy-3-methylbut-2-en-1-yl diphosphate synthase (flavodoxin) [Syntrophus sp. SKADARSKE-3]
MHEDIKRRKTRPLWIGSVQVGGDAPIVVQSMTSTDTRDVRRTVAQTLRLEKAGCEIVRVAIPDAEAAQAVRRIKEKIHIPLIADIHFDHRLALEAMKHGADGIRINPGNVKEEGIKQVVKAAKSCGTVIRIGINAGSLEKDLLARYGKPSAEALVESAVRNVRRIEDMGFDRIKISVKSSDVPTMIAAYRGLSSQVDYPLHLGVTEAGSLLNAAIKSSIGIGTLLFDGIGDTIRVSVTGDPVNEIPVAYGILRTLDIRKVGPDIISCPTCGRTEINLSRLTREVERRLSGVKSHIKIALMGCVVNGPGEAAEADIGIAGGRGYGMLFKKGKTVRKIKEEQFVAVLMEEIHAMLADKKED